MDDSYFGSQIQLMLYQTIMTLLEKYSTGTVGSAGKKAGSAAASSARPISTAAPAADGATTDFESIIKAASSKYGVDMKLVKAVIQQESSYDPAAVSSAGAMGLMQLMPATASGLGVENPMDPTQNVDGGVRLLRDLLGSYGGNVSLALAAYNAGPGAVSKYGGVPPYEETQRYVKNIISAYNKVS